MLIFFCFHTSEIRALNSHFELKDVSLVGAVVVAVRAPTLRNSKGASYTCSFVVAITIHLSLLLLWIERSMGMLFELCWCFHCYCCKRSIFVEGKNSNNNRKNLPEHKTQWSSFCKTFICTLRTHTHTHNRRWGNCNTVYGFGRPYSMTQTIQLLCSM